MSTLVATTLQDRATGDNGPVRDAAKGSARAWVRFNGTGTVAIAASYNVTSITDNGNGNYTVNFTIALADANYAAVASARAAATGAAVAYGAGVNDITAASFRISTANDGTSASTLTDNAVVSAVAFR